MGEAEGRIGHRRSLLREQARPDDAPPQRADFPEIEAVAPRVETDLRPVDIPIPEADLPRLDDKVGFPPGDAAHRERARGLGDTDEVLEVAPLPVRCAEEDRLDPPPLGDDDPPPDRCGIPLHGDDGTPLPAVGGRPRGNETGDDQAEILQAPLRAVRDLNPSGLLFGKARFALLGHPVLLGRRERADDPPAAGEDLARDGIHGPDEDETFRILETQGHGPGGRGPVDLEPVQGPRGLRVLRRGEIPVLEEPEEALRGLRLVSNSDTPISARGALLRSVLPEPGPDLPVRVPRQGEDEDSGEPVAALHHRPDLEAGPFGSGSRIQGGGRCPWRRGRRACGGVPLRDSAPRRGGGLPGPVAGTRTQEEERRAGGEQRRRRDEARRPGAVPHGGGVYRRAPAPLAGRAPPVRVAP